MSIGIDFILRAKSGDFTRAMAGVNNSLKDVKKSMREFDVGNGLKQALGVGGIIAGFRMAISHAMELRDALEAANRPISDNIATVARYGDALGKVRDGAKDLSVWALSFFTKAGEGWGNLINKIRGFSEAEQKMNEDTGRAADLAEKRRDEAYKNAATITARRKADEKRAAEEKERDAYKQAVADEKNAEKKKEALAKLAAFEKKKAFEKLSDEDKLVALAKEKREVDKDIATYAQFSEAELTDIGVNTVVELKEKQLALEKEIAEITERKASAEEMIGETIVSNTEEWRKFKGLITSTGKGDKELTDRELARKIQTTKDELFKMQVAGGYQFFEGPQRYNLQQAMNEQALRRDVRGRVAAFGEETAFKQFSGISEDRFAEILRTTDNESVQTATLKRIEDALTRKGIVTVPLGKAPTGP